MKKLTKLQIDNAAPGMHADGDGLYLQVRAATDGARSSSKSWILRYQLGGRRREMGLGSLADVGAPAARILASDARKLLAGGVDPVDDRRAKREAAAALPAAKLVTFEEVALDYISRHRAGWRNAKHAQQWENTLAAYAFQVIGEKPVAQIGTDDVLAILNPMWKTKTETATRVRSRIELVLAFAKANKLREGENPAVWRGHLSALLPKPRKVTAVKHHPALPYSELPAFMAELREHRGMSALCLQLVILTACRSGEALGAQWAEFDRMAETWIIPASRTKAATEHRAPMCASAVAVLEKAAKLRQNEWVFPGVQSGKAMTDMALTMLLRGMRSGVTVHGFRSTFRDWAAETTSYPNEMAEMALGHAVGNAVEAAYRRGDMLERRRQMMDDWARFVG